jgi:hypothetical protein
MVIFKSAAVFLRANPRKSSVINKLPSNFDDSDQVEGLDEEVTEGEVLTVRPWDPKHIRITTKNFTVREIFTQIVEGDLDLAPDFQRSFVWKIRQQIRLIESILLGIPLPAFYFNQDDVGAHQVIDGVQRLTTIRLFMSDELKLEEEHMEYLKPLQGLCYSTLDPATRRRFSGTQIVAHVIEPQTPDEVKYDIFNRVNTGGTPLSPQEIRHCMSKERSRSLLAILVENTNFDAATGYAFWAQGQDGLIHRDNRRMSDREMALRFCAFRNFSVENYGQAASLDSYLLEFTRRLDTHAVADAEYDDLVSVFDQAMINSHEILGGLAFRRYQYNSSRRGPINRAIFESQALADYSLEQLMPFQDQILMSFLELFEDPVYDNAVKSGTGDVLKIHRRLEMPRKVLEGIVR